MRFKMVLALVLALALAAVMMTGALAADMLPRNAYLEGTEAYLSRNYVEAVEFFRMAGNHKDARLWMYYCEAIDMVVNGDGSEHTLAAAKVRFELLETHEFHQAGQWASYCKGRLYELDKMPKSARECYEQILVYDSVEHYLICLNQPDLLKNEDELRSRVEPADLHMRGEPAYEVAVEFYEAEDYETAAAYFWLAGNYEDAVLWRCYCQAIALVTVEDDYSHADVLFKLLASQGFAQAEQWSLYCQGREYEKDNVGKKAVTCYQQALVHDSFERYLRLKKAE